MKQYTKKYGQVFLKDRNIGELEIKILNIPADSAVLEIGPGTGFLTSIMLRHGLTVTAIESDHRFVGILDSTYREYITQGKLKIIHANFLESDLNQIDHRYIVGNIPYSISSPIMERLMDLDFDRALFMVQLEFARRMVAAAGTKDYSRLSVFCSLNFNAKLEKKVSKNSFSPVPNVDSAIVSISKKIREGSIPWDYADGFIKEMFSRKRKKIGSEYGGEKYADLRIDQLTPEQIWEIISYLYHH